MAEYSKYTLISLCGPDALTESRIPVIISTEMRCKCSKSTAFYKLLKNIAKVNPSYLQ